MRREAVASVLDAAHEGRVRLLRSPAHDFENERNHVAASTESANRARALAALGFAPLDALHLAFAEQGQARWFITTDDRLLNRVRSYSTELQVQVLKPDELPVPGGEAE